MTDTGLVQTDPVVLLEDPLEACVETVRQLIRIPTVNPPGGESVAATWLARQLRHEGVEPVVVEPEPGRGSVVARLRGDGSAGGPLLLMGHLDVVPVDEARWSSPPFAADIVDGYIIGRGALDMKTMVAMETQVFRELARASRSGAARLRRDVILAATADEEAGGLLGMGWLVDHAAELIMAEGALNEAGGVSLAVTDRRAYPIQVGEKGHWVVRITVAGHGGHGSVPRPDATSLLLGHILGRLTDRQGDMTGRGLVRLGFATLGRTSGGRQVVRALARGSDELPEGVLAAAVALSRTTLTPTVVRAGVKDNVIPHDASVILDCRTVAGVDRDELVSLIHSILGSTLMAACTLEILDGSPGFTQPSDHPLLAIAERTLAAHDPGSLPVRVAAPFSTDAKHTRRIGIATYGFSPLRLPDDQFLLDGFHAVDERVPLAAIRFGLPVLRDVVREYCT
jgi:acetylornithine deacetylase/succinyl-diaminopimelate desuccinylase-like protein